MEWKGVLPVVPTPFDQDGELDLSSYATNIERLVDAGVHGIVALGTAGEGPSMSRQECQRVVAAAVESAGQRIPVLAGIGGPNERDTGELMGLFGKLGVDGFMIVTPYFYPLTQTEMQSYFVRVAGKTELPLCFYNSTYANLPLNPDVLEGLASDIPNFVALKEGNQLQASEVARRLGDRLAIFSARDLYLHEMLAVGGHGGFAFTANILPEHTVAIYNYAMAGDWERARLLQDQLNPLTWMILKRSFPSAIKAAMEIVGLVAGTVRPPLSALTEHEIEELRTTIEVLREASDRTRAVTA